MKYNNNIVYLDYVDGAFDKNSKDEIKKIDKKTPGFEFAINKLSKNFYGFDNKYVGTIFYKTTLIGIKGYNIKLKVIKGDENKEINILDKYLKMLKTYNDNLSFDRIITKEGLKKFNIDIDNKDSKSIFKLRKNFDDYLINGICNELRCVNGSWGIGVDITKLNDKYVKKFICYVRPDHNKTDLIKNYPFLSNQYIEIIFKDQPTLDLDLIYPGLLFVGENCARKTTVIRRVSSHKSQRVKPDQKSRFVVEVYFPVLAHCLECLN